MAPETPPAPPVPPVPPNGPTQETSGTDPLTGLANRGGLLDRLHAAKAQAPQAPLAVFYLDIDHFKAVNDRLGHTAGDRVLSVVADRLRQAVRPEDTVARLGGDEFVVVATSVGTGMLAREIAERIRAIVDTPMPLGRRSVQATVSVGVAVGPGHLATTLLDRADTALYRAKDLGRNRIEVYGGQERAPTRAAEAILRPALDEGGLQVVYHPVVDLVTGGWGAVEVGLSMPPTEGKEGTKAVLRLAEESGLIVSLRAGMLDLACEQAASWPDPGPWLLWPVSERHLGEPRSADQVLSILAAHQVAPERLTLGTDERTLLVPSIDIRRNLDRLRRAGIRLLLDDVGSGMGSLPILREFAVDIIRLSPDLTANLGQSRLGENSRNEAVIEALLAFSRALGTEVIVSGVERAEWADSLRDMGYRLAQGSYFGEPVSADDLRTALRSSN